MKSSIFIIAMLLSFFVIGQSDVLPDSTVMPDLSYGSELTFNFSNVVACGENILTDRNDYHIQCVVIFVDDGQGLNVKSGDYIVQYDSHFLQDRPYLRGYLKGVEKYFKSCSIEEKKKIIEIIAKMIR